MMQIEVYKIYGRRHRFTGSLANVNDFSYVATTSNHSSATLAISTQPFAAIQPVALLGAEEFLNNPRFTLYCFDEQQHCAIFVELPPGLDLTQAPFVHQVQYEQALSVIRVPIDLFNQLATQLPPVPQPIFLYMSARSGSTLLSHAFNASGQVTSLSEPDAFTQFVHLRECIARNPSTARLTTEMLSTLADSTMRFCFRSPSSSIHHSFNLAQAVKFRSEGVQVLDLFQHTFPQAKNIFLYRDALGWVNSFHRIFTRMNLGAPLTLDAWQTMYEGFLQTDLSHLRAYIPLPRTTLSLAEQLTLWWIAIMEWYLVQWEQGASVLAVRYEDLNQRRAVTLEAIFAYCGLPVSTVPLALSAFATDSQAGTDLARSEPQVGAMMTLERDAIGEIVAILQCHPQLRHPNFWAPGTLDLNLYLNTQRTLLAAEEWRSELSDPVRP